MYKQTINIPMQSLLGSWYLILFIHVCFHFSVKYIETMLQRLPRTCPIHRDHDFETSKRRGCVAFLNHRYGKKLNLNQINSRLFLPCHKSHYTDIYIINCLHVLHIICMLQIDKSKFVTQRVCDYCGLQVSLLSVEILVSEAHPQMAIPANVCTGRWKIQQS